MYLTIFLIFVAAALFLFIRDDHDDSYTKGDLKTRRDNGQKSVYKKSVENRRNPAASNPRPSPVLNPASSAPRSEPRTNVPKEKAYGTPRQDGIYGASRQDSINRIAALDFHFLDRIVYYESLPERTMSSFIAGVHSHCTNKDLGGVVGYVEMDRKTGAMEVHDGDGRLLGFLPMKDRAAFLAFNPTLVVCPFAGHIAVSITGSFYADIRIVLPSTRDFVEESLTGFLG